MSGNSAVIVGVTLATMTVTLCASLVYHWADWVAGCRRRGAGRCGVCGYRLIGLPVPRCPECGQVFQAAFETEGSRCKPR